MEYINDKEKKVCEFLKSINQEHLISNLTKHTHKEREEFVEQVEKLNISYPGGLPEYISRAKKLLKDSANNVNPYEGFIPQVPKGEQIDFKDLKKLDELESVGFKEIKDACFVLVAGGLGERLGYNSIKIGIPLEVLTNMTFIQYYCEYILAYQKKTGANQIPLAIMLSDDTYIPTVEIFEKHNYFGMKKEQVTLMKQDKVPSLLNNNGKIAQEKEKLLIETKPHGHGDVHVLLHQLGLTEKWLNQGKKWVIFFQDTNPLVFRIYPAMLGVSKKYNLEVNTLTVPRKIGEAVGAICHLKNSKTGDSLTINVEYNQLSGLFGDKKEEVDEHGYSKYPGNTNSLVFSLKEYTATLNKTKGLITEFINPKYTDATKTTFTSPTRLECMMQDYPKLLENGDRIGITQMDRTMCFTAAKNDLKSAADKASKKLAPESTSSCEQDWFYSNARLLEMCGVKFGVNIHEKYNNPKEKFANIPLAFGPYILLKPSFGTCYHDLKQRIKGENQISENSTIILDGDFTMEGLHLDGYLHATKEIKHQEVKNHEYIQLQELDPKAQNVPTYLQIRGYQLSDKSKQILKH